MSDEWQRLLERLNSQGQAVAVKHYVEPLANGHPVDSLLEPARLTSNQGQHFDQSDNTQGITPEPSFASSAIDQLGAAVPEPLSARDFRGTTEDSDPQRLRAVVTSCALLAAIGVGWFAGSNSREFFSSEASCTSKQQELSSAGRTLDSKKASSSSSVEATVSGTPSGAKPHATVVTAVERRPEAPSGAAQLDTSPKTKVPSGLRNSTPSVSPTAKERAKPSQSLTPVPESRPTTIAGWSLREVSGGTVVLEGPTGTFKASRGETVPGVGRVESVVRWGDRWIVATTRGLISTP
jgi:hypothetical protein